MALIGDMPRFQHNGDDWLVFTERLEQMFEINDVTAEKKKAILITCIDDDVYKTLRDLCHPMLPKEKTYEELCSLLGKQFVAKTSVFRERHAFYNACQESQESVAEWFARIKRLSHDCHLGAHFDVILIDRFISGLQSNTILDRLCEEDEDQLTMQQALEIAMLKESSIRPESAGGLQKRRWTDHEHHGPRGRGGKWKKIRRHHGNHGHGGHHHDIMHD